MPWSKPVKKLTYTILSGLLLLCGHLHADDDAYLQKQDVSAEKIAAQDTDGALFHFSVKGDWIQQAKVNKRTFNRNHVKFWEAYGQGTMVVYYNKDCKEGIILGAGYSHTFFDWNKNLYFDRTVFDEASLSVTAFSQRLCNWLWQAQFVVNWETHFSDFTDYSNYDLFLWGRYEYTCDVNLHAGFYAQTGMKIDHIYPIIGFDWTINDQWKLNCVFPFNLSIEYKYDQNWTALIAGRLFDVRYRVGKNEPLSKGLLEYRNKGVELAVNYESKYFSGNIHGGYTFGGKFIISNKNHKHKKHFNFDSSPYAGGEISLKF
jgi:hypothetical protein